MVNEEGSKIITVHQRYPRKIHHLSALTLRYLKRSNSLVVSEFLQPLVTVIAIISQNIASETSIPLIIMCLYS